MDVFLTYLAIHDFVSLGDVESLGDVAASQDVDDGLLVGAGALHGGVQRLGVLSGVVRVRAIHRGLALTHKRPHYSHALGDLRVNLSVTFIHNTIS